MAPAFEGEAGGRGAKGGRAWPGGMVVKFTRSASVAQGLWVQIPGADLHTAHQATPWWHPTYKIEEDCHGC